MTKRLEPSTIPSEVKAQHTVPQCYLRNFSINSNHLPEKQKVYSFNKVTMKHYISLISKVSVVGRFYNYTDLDGDIKTFEHELGRIENAIAPVLASVSREPIPELLNRHRDEIAFFFALLLTRSVYWRVAMKQIVNYDIHLAEQLPDFVARARKDENLLAITHANLLQDSTSVCADAIASKRWILLVARQGMMPFWTSDHPIGIQATAGLERVLVRGLLTPGVQILVPISSYVAVAMSDATTNFSDVELLKADHNAVQLVNKQQVLASTRFLYASKPEFSLAKDLIKEHPYLADPNRWLIEPPITS